MKRNATNAVSLVVARFRFAFAGFSVIIISSTIARHHPNCGQVVERDGEGGMKCRKFRLSNTMKTKYNSNGEEV